jgi:hypothetical protein
VREQFQRARKNLFAQPRDCVTPATAPTDRCRSEAHWTRTSRWRTVSVQPVEANFEMLWTAMSDSCHMVRSRGTYTHAPKAVCMRRGQKWFQRRGRKGGLPFQRPTRTECVFTESVSGVEGRRRNAAKERSPMLGPNLNGEILAAD